MIEWAFVIFDGSIVTPAYFYTLVTCYLVVLFWHLSTQANYAGTVYFYAAYFIHFSHVIWLSILAFIYTSKLFRYNP